MSGGAFAVARYNEHMLTDEDKQWIANKIAASEERMARRLAENEERMIARVEKTETTLLTEFHKWASPVEMRQRTHAAALRAVDAEMEALPDRVKKLEAS
jgi:hypothetical protein